MTCGCGSVPELSLVLQTATIADAIHYATSLASAYTLLDDGRVDLDTAPSKRKIRPVVLRERKEVHLLAGNGWRRRLIGWSLFVD